MKASRQPPRQLDDERPKRVGPDAEAVANVHDFVLSPRRSFTTRVGGLFLFVHDLVRFWRRRRAGPRRQTSRLRHDPGRPCLARFARAQAMVHRTQEPCHGARGRRRARCFCGLNAMPKKSFLSEYSSRITPQKVSRLLGLWHNRVTGEVLLSGKSQPRLPLGALFRRASDGRIALSVQAQPPPAQHPDLSCPGC